MHLRTCALAAGVAFLGFASARADTLAGPALVHAVQKGGYVIVMRHASAPLQPPQGPDADAANPGRERQLDAAGRASAVALGRAFKALHIPVGEVWTSPTFRARQTVALAEWPGAKPVAQLGDGGLSMAAAAGEQAAWLQAKAAEPVQSGADTIVVTHLPNLTAAFGQQAAGLPDGGALVFHPVTGAAPELVGRIGIEEWSRVVASK